jgi:TatA/E family protein of Tat protein translocase
MFGIGMPELILILAIALVVIGPKKLPDLAKSLGRAMNEFRKATREIKESLDVNEDFKDVRQSFDELKTDVRDAVTLNPVASSTAPKPSAGDPTSEVKEDDPAASSKNPPGDRPDA